MILLDYNGVAMANLFAGVKPQDVNEEFLRHMILNSIRMHNLKYREKYGQMVIACDYGTWRKNYFEHYKASRSKGRDDSPYDFDEVFKVFNKVREEIRDHTQYPVIHLEGIEADDIIGVLTKHVSTEFGAKPIMIVSADKDFIQLQAFNNVSQYSPRTKKLLTHENPRAYLAEHILRGDSGDGIPNVLSADDTFVEGKRQTPLSKNKLNTLLNDISEGNGDKPGSMLHKYKRNFDRNRRCIDLINYIPKDVEERILREYIKADQIASKNKGKMLNYLITRRLKMLVGAPQEFAVGS